MNAQPKPLPRVLKVKRNKAAALAEERRIYRLVDIRDARRCRLTGVKYDLEHHHIWFRSTGGPTTTANVLLLTRVAHKLVQTRHVWIDGIDANVQTRHVWIDGIDANGPVTFSMWAQIAQRLFGAAIPAHVRIMGGVTDGVKGQDGHEQTR